MGKLQICEPWGINALASSSGETSVANLNTVDPKEAFIASGVGGRAIYIDLGAARSVDSFFLGFTNADAAATVQWFSATNLAGAGAVAMAPAALVRASDAKTVRSSNMLKIAAPVTSRYWYASVQLNAAVWQIGRIALAKSLEMDWDHEWGAGRRPIDTGRSTALLGGGFAMQDGVRKSAFSWTFGDLTESELENLWGVFIRNGTTKPLIVNEVDGATIGVNEKLHYGPLQRLDAWERREPNATKWNMEIEDWA